ncbi:MAG: HD domain-containing protein [Candidatus Calescibacterium sp.]|nr:HD domain-containing protein [Candidatus Calescibacterium sp.]
MIQILYSLKYLRNNSNIKNLINKFKSCSISKINDFNLKSGIVFLTDDLNFKDIEKITKSNLKLLYVVIFLNHQMDLTKIYKYFDILKDIVKKKEIDLFYELISLENFSIYDSIEKFLSFVFDKIYLSLQDIKFGDIPFLFVEKLSEFLVLDDIYFLSLNPFNELIKTVPNNCPRNIKELFRKQIMFYKVNHSVNQMFVINKDGAEDILFFSIYNNEMVSSFAMLYLKLGVVFSDLIRPQLVNRIIKIIDYINNKLILYYRLQRNVEEIRALHNVSVLFGATTSVDELIYLIIRKAKNVFKADVCTLMLVDNDELYIKSSIGLPESVMNIRQKIGQGIAGSVVKNGKPIIINDIDKVENKFDFERNYKSSMVVPLKVGEDKVIGVLSVSKNSFYPFSENDMQTLYNLATVAATAIEKAQLYQNLNIYSQKLEESYINTIKSLAKAFEARDKYNKGHMERVLKYGLAIASELDNSLLGDDVLKLALLFHDIGKIEIPDSILNKPAKLTSEEYEVIKRHPEAGEEILKNVKFLQDVAEIVKQHQERWDGKGYPRGLKGEEIHLYARIVSLADAFDAMTSDRVYRKAMPIEEAVEEIKRNRGTQFDPTVVDAFIRAYNSGLIKVDEEINEEFSEFINIKSLKEKI